MDLIIASNNQNKINEIKKVLGKYFNNIFSLKDKNIDIEIEETGTTFEENALIKSQTICKLTGIASLGDDSGLVVKALNGAPGIYSARYSGEDCDSKKNNALLLKNMLGVEDRSAHFQTCMALSLPSGKDFITNGITQGRILTEEIGNNGFGYDPIFFSNELNKSFAEASMEEKNKVSHRGKALEKMIPILQKEISLT